MQYILNNVTLVSYVHYIKVLDCFCNQKLPGTWLILLFLGLWILYWFSHIYGIVPYIHDSDMQYILNNVPLVSYVHYIKLLDCFCNQKLPGTWLILLFLRSLDSILIFPYIWYCTIKSSVRHAIHLEQCCLGIICSLY